MERLNQILGGLFNSYINTIERQSGRHYTEWTDIVDMVRYELNTYYREKRKTLPANLRRAYQYPAWHSETEPRYKVGDLVYIKLEEPKNALGQRQPTTHFREGDIRWTTESKRIKHILYYTGKIPYRYIVN